MKLTHEGFNAAKSHAELTSKKEGSELVVAKSIEGGVHYYTCKKEEVGSGDSILVSYNKGLIQE